MNPVEFIMNCMRGFIINNINKETARDLSNTITAFYQMDRTVLDCQEQITKVLEDHNYIEIESYPVKIYREK